MTLTAPPAKSTAQLLKVANRPAAEIGSLREEMIQYNQFHEKQLNSVAQHFTNQITQIGVAVKELESKVNENNQNSIEIYNIINEARLLAQNPNLVMSNNELHRTKHISQNTNQD